MNETVNGNQTVPRKSTGRKIFACGCTIGLLYTLALIVPVLLNWNSLKHYWGNIWQDLQFTGILSEDLKQKYPSQNVEASTQMEFGSDGRSKSLVIEFTNPRFDMPTAAKERDELARSIALYVVSVSPNIDRYEYIKISFVSKVVVGLELSAFTDHQFRVDELLQINEQSG